MVVGKQESSGTWIYDPELDSWTEAPSHPSGGGGPCSSNWAMTSAGGKTWAMGEAVGETKGKGKETRKGSFH